MPFLNELYTTYQSDGYYSILVWDDALDFMQSYFDTNGWSATECYEENGDETMHVYSAAFLEAVSGAHPQNYLIDRDGNCRKATTGTIDGEPRATDWRNGIEELLGI